MRNNSGTVRPFVSRLGITTAVLLAAAVPAVALPAVASTPDVVTVASSDDASIFSNFTSTSDRTGSLVSRANGEREAVPAEAKKKAEPEVLGKRYTTARLNVRKTPSADAEILDVLEPGSKVKITIRTNAGYQQIIYQGETAWVTQGYLAKNKPAPAAAPAATSAAALAPAPVPQGPSTAPCPYGSYVEAGLNFNGDAVYRAVCNRYPDVTSYGGYRPGGGYHSTGQALDIMVSGARGWEVANWLVANSGQLGIREVIYSQQIWTAQRAGEGFRWMSDRGSITANHYDHVHVSVY